MLTKTDDRLVAVDAACADEINRFNTAIENLPYGTVRCTGLAAGQVVSHITYAFNLYTHPKVGNILNRWSICNGPMWADLLHQAGVERNPLFVTKPAKGWDRVAV